MPARSKWQSLPTEAINPSTLGIDKLSAAEKALVMGKETKADAVFVIQSIALEGVASGEPDAASGSG